MSPQIEDCGRMMNADCRLQAQSIYLDWLRWSSCDNYRGADNVWDLRANCDRGACLGAIALACNNRVLNVQLLDSCLASGILEPSTLRKTIFERSQTGFKEARLAAVIKAILRTMALEEAAEPGCSRATVDIDRHYITYRCGNPFWRENPKAYAQFVQDKAARSERHHRGLHLLLSLELAMNNPAGNTCFKISFDSNSNDGSRVKVAYEQQLQELRQNVAEIVVWWTGHFYNKRIFSFHDWVNNFGQHALPADDEVREERGKREGREREERGKRERERGKRERERER
jgi:hypothetical protein